MSSVAQKKTTAQLSLHIYYVLLGFLTTFPSPIFVFCLPFLKAKYAYTPTYDTTAISKTFTKACSKLQIFDFLTNQNGYNMMYSHQVGNASLRVKGQKRVAKVIHVLKPTGQFPLVRIRKKQN